MLVNWLSTLVSSSAKWFLPNCNVGLSRFCASRICQPHVWLRSIGSGVEDFSCGLTVCSPVHFVLNRFERTAWMIRYRGHNRCRLRRCQHLPTEHTFAAANVADTTYSSSKSPPPPDRLSRSSSIANPLARYSPRVSVAQRRNGVSPDLRTR